MKKRTTPGQSKIDGYQKRAGKNLPCCGGEDAPTSRGMVKAKDIIINFPRHLMLYMGFYHKFLWLALYTRPPKLDCFDNEAY